jgi:hypothetical protein
MHSLGIGWAARRMLVVACVTALGGSLIGACQLGRPASTQVVATTATLSPGEVLHHGHACHGLALLGARRRGE